MRKKIPRLCFRTRETPVRKLLGSHSVLQSLLVQEHVTDHHFEVMWSYKKVGCVPRAHHPRHHAQKTKHPFPHCVLTFLYTPPSHVHEAVVEHEGAPRHSCATAKGERTPRYVHHNGRQRTHVKCEMTDRGNEKEGRDQTRRNEPCGGVRHVQVGSQDVVHVHEPMQGSHRDRDHDPSGHDDVHVPTRVTGACFGICRYCPHHAHTQKKCMHTYNYIAPPSP